MSDRSAAKAARLAELAARNDGSDVGRLALEVADLVNVTAYEEPGGPGRVDRLEAELDARLTVHELAITELYRRIGADAKEETQTTVFGIPDPLGEVIDRLEASGLLRRVGPANHTAVIVPPARQGSDR